MELRWVEDGAAAASLAWLCSTGLVYVVVFVSDHRRPAHGWLAAQSLLSCAFPAGVLGLLGGWPRELLAAALPTAGVASVFFTHAHYGAGRPGLPWAALLVAGAAIAALARLGVVSAAAPAVVTALVVAVAVVHQVAFLAKRAARGAMNARLLLAGWLLVGAGEAVDVAFGVRISAVTLAAFSFFMTVALAREHLRQQHRNDHLQDQLAERLQMLEASSHEIALLNAELRRQIGLRSRQLAHALARLGAAGAAVPDGEILGGRYQVVRPLGSGAMGAVYEVVRLADARRFALKLLHGDADHEVRVRFAREAQILAELDHPNLVAIVDVDVTERDELYLVMDLVSGTTLDRARERGEGLGFALPALRQVADGLAAIHRAGVIHRDLKPGNILVSMRAGGGAHVKIADFGVSSLAGKRALCDTQPLDRVDDVTTAHATRRGVVVGTPLYMAPELADSGAAGFAADVWSFGVLAHELCAGQRPFDEPAFTRRLLGVAIEAPPPLAGRSPGLAPPLAALLDACLDLEPSRRPTAAELATMLAEHAAAVAPPPIGPEALTAPY